MIDITFMISFIGIHSSVREQAEGSQDSFLNQVNKLMLINLHNEGAIISRYGRDGEMAQKVIEGYNDTCRHMHLILRWLQKF